MPRLAVIIASTRPTRKGKIVADWFIELAHRDGRFEIEPLDLVEIDLPLLNEPKHPRFGDYQHGHTRAWSNTIDSADAFVVVTPEYDHGPPAALINALQYLVKEWAYKPIGFVSYGGVSGGTRSVNTLKMTVTTLKMMPMVESVAIPFFAQYIEEEGSRFAPPEVQEQAAKVMLDEILRWAEALRPLREGR